MEGGYYLYPHLCEDPIISTGLARGIATQQQLDDLLLRFGLTDEIAHGWLDADRQRVSPPPPREAIPPEEPRTAMPRFSIPVIPPPEPGWELNTPAGRLTGRMAPEEKEDRRILGKQTCRSSSVLHC
jgi:hypothetical protein